MERAKNTFQRLFGVLLIVFVGMNVFDWEPPPIAPQAQPLWDAIIETGYIMPLVILVYGITGIAFLLDRFAALAAILLVPVSINIFLFHLFLNAPSIPFAATFLICNTLLIVIHWSSYAHLVGESR
jgi:putative oxidoreductase